MPTLGAFPYDLNHLLGGATRVLYAPITADVPDGPSDIFQQTYPYNPIGGAYVAADVASGAGSFTVNDGSSLPASGSLYTILQGSGSDDITFTRSGNTITVTGSSLTEDLPEGTFVHTANGWRDFGATREAFNYGRNVAAQGQQIQQVSADVLEEVTDVQRTAAVSIAEIRPELLAIIEEGSISTAESETYDVVSFGTIHELTQYRIAFVARRNKQSGIVTETSTSKSRGRFVVGLGFRTQLSADNVQMGMAKGELASATVTFRFFPETSGVQTEGTEFGQWFIERERTI